MRGSLHCAVHDETVSSFGRGDAVFGWDLWRVWGGHDWSLRFPDAVVAADVEHAEHVEHPVEVALIAYGHGGAPEFFDEGFFVGAGSCGEASDRGGGEHADGVASGEGFAVEGVAVGEHADALTDEKFLDAVGEDDFAWVFAPPVVVC